MLCVISLNQFAAHSTRVMLTKKLNSTWEFFNLATSNLLSGYFNSFWSIFSPLDSMSVLTFT